MKKASLLFLALLICSTVSAQYLYPEHYKEKISSFCLDCGNPQAMPPDDMLQQMWLEFNKKAALKVEGDIYIQVLVDSVGNARLLSADNRTNVKSKKLRLRQAVNAIRWTPSSADGTQSVQLQLSFYNDRFSVRRLSMTFRDSESHPEVERPDLSLSYQWQVYNTGNSNLPANMSRAVGVDSNGIVWMGTDNGLARFDGSFMQVYNCKNVPQMGYPLDETKSRTRTAMAMAVDAKCNKWVSLGYVVMRYNDTLWTEYNEENSPVNWVTHITVDKRNNVWCSGFHGLACYDGQEWHHLDSIEYNLPSNNMAFGYYDSRGRLWLGTTRGAVVIEDGRTEDYAGTPFSMRDRYATHIQEDSQGNVWVMFYGGDDAPNGGLQMLDTQGQWHEIRCPDIKHWGSSMFSDFAVDERHRQVWIAIYHTGLLLYDMDSDHWELYTPDNSALPHEYIEDITLDRGGTLWAATFGGFAKALRTRD